MFRIPSDLFSLSTFLVGHNILILFLAFSVSTTGLTMEIGRPSITITESDRENKITDVIMSRQVELAKGGTLTLKLKAQLGTGYSWSVTKINSDLMRITAQGLSGSSLPGGMEDMVFRFEALAPGETEVDLQYVRIFDRDTPPLKIFHLYISILTE